MPVGTGPHARRPDAVAASTGPHAPLGRCRRRRHRPHAPHAPQVAAPPHCPRRRCSSTPATSPALHMANVGVVPAPPPPKLPERPPTPIAAPVASPRHRRFPKSADQEAGPTPIATAARAHQGRELAADAPGRAAVARERDAAIVRCRNNRRSRTPCRRCRRSTSARAETDPEPSTTVEIDAEAKARWQAEQARKAPTHRSPPPAPTHRRRPRRVTPSEPEPDCDAPIGSVRRRPIVAGSAPRSQRSARRRRSPELARDNCAGIEVVTFDAATEMPTRKPMRRRRAGARPARPRRDTGGHGRQGGIRQDARAQSHRHRRDLGTVAEAPADLGAEDDRAQADPERARRRRRAPARATSRVPPQAPQAKPSPRSRNVPLSTAPASLPPPKAAQALAARRRRARNAKRRWRGSRSTCGSTASSAACISEPC